MTNGNRWVIGRGAAYLYIETVASLISGYLFWIIMSKISPTDTIGISSAVVSLAGIITVVATIGVPSGILRFLGKSFGEHDLSTAKLFFKSSLFLVCLGSITCVIVLVLLRDWTYEVFPIDLGLLLVAIVIIVSSVIGQLFRSVFVSSLKTKSLPSILLLSSIVKIVLAIALVLQGTGALGLVIGYASYLILTAVLLGIMIARNAFRPVNEPNPVVDTPRVGYRKSIHEILTASIVYWIPYLITIVGLQLGPLVVFGYGGSNEAGVYFIALTIVVGVTNVMYSLFTIAIPALSSMKDGRKRFSWQAIRLSAILVLPFSYALIFFSEEILQLLGQDYTEGSMSLNILLLSMLPTTVSYGVQSLVYAYGNYRQVLVIGLATSVPRTLLYFLLVPDYGGTGAAIGYTAGAVGGLIISIIIAKEIRLKLNWSYLVITIAVPIGVAAVFDYFHVNYIISIICTLAISYPILFKFHILLRTDIAYILDILPVSIARPVKKVLRKIEKG